MRLEHARMLFLLIVPLVWMILIRVFTAHVHCNDSVGMFRALPLNESSAFSQVRIYRPDQELDGAGPNVPLLREVSELTGGRFNPEPSSIFTPDG